MRQVIVSFLCICLVACGGNTSDSESELGSSCLADLIEGNQIEKMITASQIAEIVGKSETDLELKDNKSNSAEYSTMSYIWEPDEERLMIMEQKIPLHDGGTHTIRSEAARDNQVIFGEIRVIEDKEEGPKEYFRYTYGPKTKGEKEAIKKSIDKSKNKSDKVDEKSAETIKKMVDKQSANQVDVGTLAYYGIKNYYNVTEVRLRVLHKNTMFKLTVDVSADTEKDLEVAKKVAQQIIANCE